MCRVTSSLESVRDDTDDDTKDGSHDCQQQYCHNGNGSRSDIAVRGNWDTTGGRT